MASTYESSRVQLARLRKPGYDPWVIASTVALVCLGLVMVYSASVSDSFTSGAGYYLIREAAFVACGLTALAIGASVHYSVWQRLSPFMAVGCLLLLVFVLIPHIGTTSNGAQRWFQFKGFQVEPSEFAKLALAMYFANWLSRKGDKVRSFAACTVPFGVMLGAVCILVLLQPDMGTAVVTALAMITVYFVAGARMQHLAAGIFGGLAIAVLGVSVEGYRIQRIQVWENPFRYASGSGYHIVQVLIALGRGGLFGVGPGNSIQKYVLPAPFTDSIFAVTAEELGFVGAMLIIGLFVLLAYRGFKIAREAPDDFGRLLAVGITATIVIQAFVNIAVITNTVPFTGVPLPFISYGGSSLVACMFGVGVLLNISWQAGRRQQGKPQDDSEGTPRNANRHHRRKDGRTRVSGVGRRRVPVPAFVRARFTGTTGIAQHTGR